MSKKYRPSPAKALALFKKYFLNRTDFVAIVAPWGKPHPVKGGDKYLDALLTAHVLGEEAQKATIAYTKSRGKGGLHFQKGWFRLGSYCPAPPDNTTKWLCIDFDGGEDHANALEDPLNAALACLATCRSVNLPAYLEKSGGGKGWHVWIFFEPMIPASEARRLGFLISPHDQITIRGEIADSKHSRGIEIFPKQDKLTKKGFGNLVWIPFCFKAAGEGANNFFEINEGQLLEYLPEGFFTIDEKLLAESIKTLEEIVKEEIAEGIDPETDREVKTAKTDHTKKSAGDQTEGGYGSPSWIDWRRQALAKINLEDYYGNLLTGGCSGHGWLEARAFDSPTGDRSPSAGVADGTGEAERGVYHNFRTSESLSLFDFMIRLGMAVDFADAVKQIAKTSGIPLPDTRQQPKGKRARDPAGPQAARRQKRRPEIQINGRSLDAIIKDAWFAFRAANKKPHLFYRGGELVKLSQDEDGVYIQRLDFNFVYGFMVRWADWVKITETSVTKILPQERIAKDMTIFPDDSLPKLEAITTIPVFNRRGELVQKPGYHSSIRAWYSPAVEFSRIQIPQTPTQKHIEDAKHLLFTDLLGDFPFVTKSDRAHFLGALLTPFIRLMFTGVVPLHLIEAPTPGSGKSLLCNLLSIIVRGRAGESKALSRSDEEIRKTITAELASAPSIIILDNVNERTPVDSSPLAAVLTTEYWTDRILGETKKIRVPNKTLWLMTSNNPRLSLEMARRTLRIRLDPKTDRPWQRTGFLHTNILGWAKRHRPELIEALLTLIQYWIVHGAHLGSGNIGGFEPWSEIISGILEAADEHSFIDNIDELYDDADDESEQWRIFTELWFYQQREHDRHQLVTDLIMLAEDNNILGDVIGDRSDRSKIGRLGKALRRNRDRQYGNYKIKKGTKDSHDKRQAWIVEYVGKGQAPPSEQMPHGGQETLFDDYAAKDTISPDLAVYTGDVGAEGLPFANGYNDSADSAGSANIDENGSGEGRPAIRTFFSEYSETIDDDLSTEDHNPESIKQKITTDDRASKKGETKQRVADGRCNFVNQPQKKDQTDQGVADGHKMSDRPSADRPQEKNQTNQKVADALRFADGVTMPCAREDIMNEDKQPKEEKEGINDNAYTTEKSVRKSGDRPQSLENTKEKSADGRVKKKADHPHHPQKPKKQSVTSESSNLVDVKDDVPSMDDIFSFDDDEK